MSPQYPIKENQAIIHVPTHLRVCFEHPFMPGVVLGTNNPKSEKQMKSLTIKRGPEAQVFIDELVTSDF